MKKAILFLVFFVVSVNFCLAQEWFTSLYVAKKLAIIQNKMLLVVWEDSFNNSYPIKVSNNKGELIIIDLAYNDELDSLIWEYFVPVMLLDFEYTKLSKNIKETRGVKYFNKLIDDSIKIMDANGNIINNNSTNQPIENLSLLIKRYSFNTFLLKQELNNYSKKKNFVTAFSLASKYIDYAIFVDKDVRLEVMQLADIYFDEANTYLMNSDLKNKKAFLQKRDLLKIKEFLILNKAKKAFRFLKKLNSTEIDKINEPLFNFLNYTTFKLLKNENKALLWKHKVSLNDIKKATLIMNNNL